MTSKRFAPGEFNALMKKIDTFMGAEISLVDIIQAAVSPAINRHEAGELADMFFNEAGLTNCQSLINIYRHKLVMRKLDAILSKLEAA